MVHIWTILAVQAKMDTSPKVERTPADRRATARAALRTFFRICEFWDLDTAQQMKLLGTASRSTFFKWKKEGAAALPRDTLERISYILSIYKALQILLPNEDAADSCVR